MIKIENLLNKKIVELENQYPFIISFFESNKLDTTGFEESTLDDYLNHFSLEEKEDFAIDIDRIKSDIEAYINQMIDFLGLNDNNVEELTIVAGVNKFGEAEEFEDLVIKKSQIVSIVGPTGSGKSRLLADIEWAANGDTPTERKILINGEPQDISLRFSTSNKLVAQLSQNMNFVMDLTVHEFLELHAKSRMIDNVEEIIKRIIEAANELAGEKFDLDTPITGLSGGQSRALMIADTAILSKSPIVLIDEIENAGIDRKRALNLLVGEEKIILMATHDPTLALMADKRIIIKNGGIHKVIETDEDEKEILVKLEAMDSVINKLRQSLRQGEKLKNF